MAATPEFDLRERLSVLQRSWRLLTLFVLSAMLTSLALTYFFSERYRATTTILYRPNKDIKLEGLGQQQQTLGFPVPAVYPFEALGLTVKEVGTSERILRPVVVDLKLDQPDPNPPDGLGAMLVSTKDTIKDYAKKTWQVLKYGRTIEGDKTSQAIVDLAKNTTIDSTQKKFAATLIVADKDPVRAAKIVDRIGHELIRFMQEQSVQSARERAQELDEQLLKKKSDIDRMRTALESLKSSMKFIDLEKETSLHLQTAESLEQDLLKNNIELAAARARLTSLVELRSTLPAMDKASETVADDPVYNRLRETRATLEVELKGLVEQLPRDAPEIRAVNARIKTTDTLLAAQKATRVSQVSTEVNKIYQSLHDQELKARSEVAGLEAAHTSLTTGLERAQARIPKPAIEAKHNDLLLQLTALESDYRKLAVLCEEVRATQFTTKAEVFALHPATPPDEPFKPIKFYHVMLSAALAFCLGLGWIYLADYLRSLMGPEKTELEKA